MRPAPGSAAYLVALLLIPASAGAQGTSVEGMDSTQLVERARERQQNFERFRQSRIPVEPDRPGASCDQRIGRICIWFGGEGEAFFPPEPTETNDARRGLIGILLQTQGLIKDPWVTGQLVHYLVEQEDYTLARQVATDCGLTEEWWCSALLGYALHGWGDFPEAEEAFRDALGSMPRQERAWWTTLRYVLPPEEVEAFEALTPAEQEVQWETFWRLSDPLFLLEGNDRFTDHMARLVQVRNFESAEHAQGMYWDDDLAETLVRYGRIVGWSRTHDPAAPMRGGEFRLQDTRRVVGHHHPYSRGYLFPEEFMESPADVPPESWITAPREARTWYAPPYAPDLRSLETQVGRFRRDDQMLVVGAYRPSPDQVHDNLSPPGQVTLSGPTESALILVPLDGGPPQETFGIDSEGVLMLLAPPGRYVASTELLDARGRRAWRARQGVKQVPLIPGLVGVSDLMILNEGAPFPASLDDAVPHIRPGIRVRGDERFTVIWEVYGLRVEEPVQVTVGFTRGRPGFLTRVGEFLGVLEPDRPVEVTFGDTGPDQLQTAFRAITLELPDVEPGEYTLHLRLDLSGREPAIASRPIIVER